jgi:hypothetical protein
MYKVEKKNPIYLPNYHGIRIGAEWMHHFHPIRMHVLSTPIWVRQSDKEKQISIWERHYPLWFDPFSSLPSTTFFSVPVSTSRWNHTTCIFLWNWWGVWTPTGFYLKSQKNKVLKLRIEKRKEENEPKHTFCHVWDGNHTSKLLYLHILPYNMMSGVKEQPPCIYTFVLYCAWLASTPLCSTARDCSFPPPWSI